MWTVMVQIRNVGFEQIQFSTLKYNTMI